MYSRDIVGIVITSVVMVCIFTFISVKVWADGRRREREAFYRSEVLKKLAESTGPQAQQVLERVREDDLQAELQRRGKVRIAGLIVMGAGIGVIAMFALLSPGGAWAIGLIPLLVGVAMSIYGFLLWPDPRKGSQA